MTMDKKKLKKMASKCLPKGKMIKAAQNLENTRDVKTIDRLNK